MRRLIHSADPIPNVLCFIAFALIAGCGSVAKETKLEPGYIPPPMFTVSLGAIVDSSPPIPDDEKVDLDAKTKLGEALRQKLSEHGLTKAIGEAADRYTLRCEIKEYRPGSAFKRWLMPGHGSTILTVESELHAGDVRIASLSNKRTVDAGGAYTAGAYESIFNEVAEDIATELKQKLVRSE